nr:hypothetical protein [Tanacetum cinerariifolium]
VRQAHIVDTDNELEPEDTPSEVDGSQPLGSRVSFISEEIEAYEPSSTGTISSHSLVSSDSTVPLSPDHPLTHASPTPTPTQVSFHSRTARMAVRTQPTLSPGMSARIPKAITLSPSSFPASEPLGLGYRAARRHALESTKEIAPSTYGVGQSSRVYTNIPTYAPPAAPVQTPSSPEWSLGSLPILPSSPVVPLFIASLVATPAATISIDEVQFLEVRAQLELHGSILHDHTQRLDALPPTLFEGYDKDLRELYTRSGEIRDENFS